MEQMESMKKNVTFHHYFIIHSKFKTNLLTRLPSWTLIIYLKSGIYVLIVFPFQLFLSLGLCNGIRESNEFDSWNFIYDIFFRINYNPLLRYSM